MMQGSQTHHVLQEIHKKRIFDTQALKIDLKKLPNSTRNFAQNLKSIPNKLFLVSPMCGKYSIAINEIYLYY